MKNLLIVACLVMFGSAQAQPTGMSNVSFTFKCNTCATPATYVGLLWLPPDFYTSAKKHPLLYFHSGTIDPQYASNPAMMAGAALPDLLLKGMRLDSIKGPDGQYYSFVMLALINGPYMAWDQEAKWLKATYGDRFDDSRRYVTGYSQGGLMTTLGMVSTDSITSKISAYVPMSTPNVPVSSYDWKQFTRYKQGVWFFAGKDDRFTAAGTILYDSLAKVYDDPANVQMTIYNGGHCCWNTYYDVSYKDPVTGMNIYQWMLRYPALTPLAVKLISQRLYKQ